MRIKKISLVLCVLLIISCKRDTTQQPDERIQRWLDYYGLTLSDFDEDDQQAIPYRIRQDFDSDDFELYKSLFIYSPDSTKAIDLDSYHLELKMLQDGKLFTSGRDVDMEAGFVDFEKSVRTRLLFCGPACLFEEASFSPEGMITITGFADDGMGYAPVIWEIDPISLSVKLSSAPQVFEASKIRYVHEVRLDHVIFALDPDDFHHLDVPL